MPELKDVEVWVAMDSDGDYCTGELLQSKASEGRNQGAASMASNEVATLNVSELARQYGVSRTTIRRRLAAGWAPPCSKYCRRSQRWPLASTSVQGVDTHGRRPFWPSPRSASGRWRWPSTAKPAGTLGPRHLQAGRSPACRSLPTCSPSSCRRQRPPCGMLGVQCWRPWPGRCGRLRSAWPSSPRSASSSAT